MHILLTGATGFIGRHVLGRLIRNGYDISILARREPDSEMLSQIHDSTATWIVTDLTDDSRIAVDRSRLETVTHVVHLAALIPKKSGEQIQLAHMLRDNITSLVGLIERLPSTLESMCYISTVDVYGSIVRLPVDEFHPTQPVTSYGVSKLAAETVCRLMLANSQASLTILRLSHVYGPGESAYDKVIPISIRKAINKESLQVFGEGLDERDFVYIEDVVDSIELALHTKPGGVFNIAGGESVRIIDLINIIVRHVPGTTITFLPSNQQSGSIKFDIRSAHDALGFNPKISIDEGLKREIQWFQQLRP